MQISRVVPGQRAGRLENTVAARCTKEIGALKVYVGMFECHDIVLETGNRISVVDSHHFLVGSGQWVPAGNLRNGSKLSSLTGPIEIRSIVKRVVPFVGRVYNLKVKDAERYFVGKNGLIVRDY